MTTNTVPSSPAVGPRARKKVRKTRPAGRWVTARKAVQGLALILFIGLFIWSQRGGWPATTVNLPMRLDPLLMLAQSLASRTLLAGSVVALIFLLLSLVFGRAWCGWLCPLGTTLDLFPLDHWRGRRASPGEGGPGEGGPGEGWRGVKYALLIATLAAALLGNLTLLFFDPLTIWFRKLAFVRTVLWIVLFGAALAIVSAIALRIGLSSHMRSLRLGSWSFNLNGMGLQDLFTPGSRGYSGAMAFKVAAEALFIALAPASWVAAYFRLGEAEV